MSVPYLTFLCPLPLPFIYLSLFLTHGVTERGINTRQTRQTRLNSPYFGLTNVHLTMLSLLRPPSSSTRQPALRNTGALPLSHVVTSRALFGHPLGAG